MVMVVATPHFLEVAEMQGEDVLESVGSVVLDSKLGTRLFHDRSDPMIVRLQHTCKNL